MEYSVVNMVYANYVDTGAEAFGKTIEEVVRDTIVTWFEAFRAECDLGAATEAQRSASAQP